MTPPENPRQLINSLTTTTGVVMTSELEQAFRSKVSLGQRLQNSADLQKKKSGLNRTTGPEYLLFYFALADLTGMVLLPILASLRWPLPTTTFYLRAQMGEDL